jgi:tagatose 1,6-diphosphate aldolase GatY/KbaY
LDAAMNAGNALGAFSTYNLEFTQAIIAAAERVDRPVIIQAGAGAFAYSGRGPLAAMALGLAAESRAAVGVHLDHSKDLGEIEACLALGYSSVMIDGSGLDFDDNVALTRSASSLAHSAGAWIEGELGAMDGNEDVSRHVNPAQHFTDPESVRTFVRETGVDALAVAIGNVHGVSKDPVQIDFERLGAIKEQCTVPLVLHGASGLSDEVIRRAVSLGVAKVNLNAELRRAFFDALRKSLLSSESDSVSAIMRPARDAVEHAVADKLMLLWPG